MKKLITICLILGAGLCATASARGDKSPSDSKIQKIQQVLNKADEARDTKKYPDAVKLYKEALAGYEKLSGSYPEWQPGVTQFRIAYCRNQLEALTKKPDKKAPAPEAAPAQTSQPKPPEIPRVTNDVLRIEEPRPPDKTGETAKARPKDTGQGKKSVETICSESKMLLEKGETDKALSLLMDGLAREPDNSPLRLLLGIGHCRKSEYENAVYLMEPLVKEEPSNTVARVVLGTAYFGLGRIPDAKKEMQKTLSINPRSREAHYNLAQIMLTEQPPDTEAARAHYKTALDMGSKPDTNLDLLLKEPAAEK